MENATPLLESPEANKCEKRWRRVLDLKEAKCQVFLSVPMILTNVSYFCIPLVSVMFAGHLGELQLAGATLANSWSSVTGLALMTGLSGALETLCGQGYGAKLYRMLGIYLQSSMIIAFVLSVAVSFVWFYSEQLLILLHQDPEIAKVAGIFLRYLIPGLFAYGFLQCLLRFLQTQSIVIPLLICSLVPLVIHAGVAYLLVYYTSLGFKGASLAASLSLWLSFFLLATYIKFSRKFKHTWEGLSTECFNHALTNIKLAIPSAVMVCLEYWAFELLVLLAGLMPNSESTTSLIAMCVNTEAVAYMVTYGFAAVVSTRVSNELGSGNVDRAKNALYVTLKLSIFLALMLAALLLFGHDIWASFFSDSRQIKEQFASLTPLLTVSILLDSMQGILSGVSRGCGWQHLAAWTNLGAFYVIGMPSAIVLGFKLGLYAKGLWIGLICGLLSQVLILLIITLWIKWSGVKLSCGDSIEV